jgi:hypothetical protein
MVFLHCGQIDGPDLRAVHLLAGATLRAKRAGSQARLAFVSRDLLQVIAFVGLEGVLIVAAGFPPRS